MKKIVTKSNAAEFQKLINKYNFLLEELIETTERIVNFKVKIETMPAIEVLDIKQ